MVRLALILSLFLFGCQNNEKQFSFAEKQYASQGAFDVDDNIDLKPPRTAEPPPPPPISIEKGSKLIRSGKMEFEIAKLERSKSKVDSILSYFGGYYENEVINTYTNKVTSSMKIRVPIAKFDSIVWRLENGLGKLTRKNISARDVTEEYLDLNIRLESNLAYLDQYKAILKKAKSIKEIIDIQEKIRYIEEEIESKKGRLRYLDDKVSYSTLDLELSEFRTKSLSDSPSFRNRIAKAFNNGIKGFLSFIVFLVTFWPFASLIVLLLLFRKNVFGFLKRKRKKQ